MASEETGKPAATNNVTASDATTTPTTATEVSINVAVPIGVPMTTVPVTSVQQLPAQYHYMGHEGYHGQGPPHYYHQAARGRGRGAGRGNYRPSGMYSGGGGNGMAGAVPKTCYNCGESGHIARDCTGQRLEGQCREVITKAKSKYRRCFNCGKMGHMSADCTVPAGNKACYHCGQDGHIAKECPNPPQEEGTK